MAKNLTNITKSINKWIKQYDDVKFYKVKPPTKAGFRYYAGITRDNDYNWKKQADENTKNGKKYIKVSDAIKKAEDLILAHYEESLLRGGNHLTGVIFLLKTTFQYREKAAESAQTVNIVISTENEGQNEI